jgi:hypothetical protein
MGNLVWREANFVQQKKQFMKREKIIYWSTTGLISAGMLFSAFLYLTKGAQLMKTFHEAGYPEYFVTLLGTAKLLGGIALVVPLQKQVKEWAYAGFTFVFLGAIWTHVATGTPWVAPLIALILLSISYWFRGKVLSV